MSMMKEVPPVVGLEGAEDLDQDGLKFAEGSCGSLVQVGLA